MYEGNAVDLQMEKVIAADAILDDETHHCQVFVMIWKRITYTYN